MTSRNENDQIQPCAHDTAREGQQGGARTLKPFVEPVISSPVDVLAATTFFQVVDSGGTLRRPRND
jgi:hypothetical protein